MVNTARNLGSERKTPRIRIGYDRQEFWALPKNDSPLNWSIAPEILDLAEKCIAFKLVNTARNFGSDRKAPRAQIGKKRPGILALTDKHLTFELVTFARISVLTDNHLASELLNTAGGFGPDRKTPRIPNGKRRQELLVLTEKTPGIQSRKYRQDFRR